MTRAEVRAGVARGLGGQPATRQDAIESLHAWLVEERGPGAAEGYEQYLAEPEARDTVEAELAELVRVQHEQMAREATTVAVDDVVNVAMMSMDALEQAMSALQRAVLRDTKVLAKAAGGRAFPYGVKAAMGRLRRSYSAIAEALRVHRQAGEVAGGPLVLDTPGRRNLGGKPGKASKYRLVKQFDRAAAASVYLAERRAATAKIEARKDPGSRRLRRRA